MSFGQGPADLLTVPGQERLGGPPPPNADSFPDDSSHIPIPKAINRSSSSQGSRRFPLTAQRAILKASAKAIE
jgi:hypothetical protein